MISCFSNIIYDMILEMMRYVLDTNIIIAGLRSASGASAALLRLVLEEKCKILISVPLALEYEAKCLLPEHRVQSGLQESEVELVIATLCSIAEPVQNHFLWRPQLRDAADEMVLETAINGNADGLVTFNIRDFGQAPARFGIALLTPQKALKRIKI